MPRAAGSSSHYEIGVIDSTGAVRGRTVKLPGVTSILGATIPKNLSWWGYKLGVEAAQEYALNTKTSEFLDMGLEDLYTALKRRKAVTPQTVLKKAGERGTRAHGIVERLLKGESPTWESNPYVDGFMKWFTNWDISSAKMIAVEEPLFSLKHGYAGTVDAIFEHAGNTVVMDFKTSKAIYESHLIQAVAYGQAAIEMGYVDHVDTCLVVAAHEDGTYEEEVSPYELETFLALKRVYELL